VGRVPAGIGEILNMKALIIGHGSIGSRHANIIFAMDEFDEVVVLSSQKNLFFKTITSLNDIAKINPDYIVIASNTSLHFEQLQFLEENFRDKTIIVEKPLFDQIHKLNISKNKVYIGYNLRFHPMIRKIKEICESRRLWSIYTFCGSYLPGWRPGRDYSETASAKKITGGGVLLDLSHELDYIQWIAGDISPEHTYNEKLSNLEIDTDDFLMLAGKTASGARLHIGLNYFTRKPIRQIIIDGEGVSIQADLITNYMNVNVDEQANDYTWPEVERNYTYIAQHSAIVNCDFSDVCTFFEGMKTMKLIDRIKSNSQ
jgi:predicted dehydrogenase